MPYKQFFPVDCSRGAPMGRAEYGAPADCAPRSVSVFKVALSGDYDDGGAYWGSNSNGTYLYCAQTSSNIEYQGGYNTSTSNQDGETFFDGLSGQGYGIHLNGKSFIQ
jgi:hypothetical protein